MGVPIWLHHVKAGDSVHRVSTGLVQGHMGLDRLRARHRVWELELLFSEAASQARELPGLEARGFSLTLCRLPRLPGPVGGVAALSALP